MASTSSYDESPIVKQVPASGDAGSLSFRHRFDPQAAAYVFVNLFSACAVVFANKLVFAVAQFRFTVALTCIHTVATLVTAQALASLGIIRRTPLPTRAVYSLAAAFAGYIVLCNISLLVNTVGFYQLTKIMIAPVVLIMGSVADRQLPSLRVSACVIVVCLGVALATIYDKQVTANIPGAIVGCVSVVVSAMYGTWIGSMTKQHGVSSMQLLDQYLPYAACLMVASVPVECWALRVLKPEHPSLLQYRFGALSLVSIAISSLLGVLVTFSTFLVIEKTSPLTYAVVGHVKTVLILGGGVLFFGDQMTPVKAVGVAMAIGGVIAYSRCR